MKCIESQIGQSAENLADALNRTHTDDGKFILQVLHKQGLLRKVQTEQVTMTPNTTTKINLSELNKILDDMAGAENATKKLAELDAQATQGTKPSEVAKAMRNPPPAVSNPTQGILGDDQLANNLLAQARRMEAEAKGLLAESARLQQEANEMMGIPVATQTTVTSEEPAKRGRGRPKKVQPTTA
jgi:uncharacterized phage infection (PIP) family protein YhgE